MKNMDEFNAFTDEIQKSNIYKEAFAWGFARVEKGRVCPQKSLNATYAVVNFRENFKTLALMLWAISEIYAKNGKKFSLDDSECVFVLNKKIISKALKIFEFLVSEAKGNAHRNLQNLVLMGEILDHEKEPEFEFVLTIIFDDSAPKSVESAYLKLYLLSLNKVMPRSLNLDGIFSIMPNLAWDEYGRPLELEWLRENEIWLKMSGVYPKISFVDKFPRFLSHIVPNDSVRILDDAKVRFGASIGDGTTIMPGASYVNFNAGTLGKAMIEGRVSSSVVVGNGSDVGGGASILGVLSGTNGNPVSIGERCLLGANSVTGIPLGDDCVVDGGVAILEGTKIAISADEREKLAKINTNFTFDKEIYKAKELGGLSALHFRQNSQNGQICATLNVRAIKLNENLH